MLSRAKSNEDTVCSPKTCLDNIKVGYRTLKHKLCSHCSIVQTQ